MYRGQYIPIPSFKGGYCGNLSPSQLSLDQAADLDNIVLSPDGKGFRTRLGNSKFTVSTLGTSTPVPSLGAVNKTGTGSFFVSTCGTKLLATTNTGTNADITGTLTITSGSTNSWDFFAFNDNVIGFGGPIDAPDAPLTWNFNTASNATALGGTPPSAYGAFTANNRVFAFRTAANPSTIYWSVLANGADWTSTGSGSAVVGSLKDGEPITGSCNLSTNYQLVFKTTSTYQMVLTQSSATSGFPIYTLFAEMGCVGKKACINIDGTVYWINQYGRMVSTDGENLKTYPINADNLWNNIAAGKRYLIQAARQKGADYDWLVWLCTQNNGNNDTAIIWDLLNKCWLRCSTGYKMNSITNDDFGSVYMGSYTGDIYVPDQAGVYADASESSPGTITAFWRTGWMNANLEKVEQIRRVTVEYKTKASGSITVNYGFDFVADSASFTLSQVAAGSETYATRFSALSGRGNFIQLKIGQSSSTIDSSISQILLGGKAYGQKRFTAT